MALYETREQAMQGCIRESDQAIKSAEQAIKRAENDECRLAWSNADTAMMAAKCAMQAHDELWELSKGDLTDEEFEAFEKAEIAMIKARNAQSAAAHAVDRANYYEGKKYGKHNKKRN